MKKTISVCALVCALLPLVCITASAQTEAWRYRAGLRNSRGGERLNAAQLRLLLDSLRHQTGFLDMQFDEAGFLTLGERTRLAGGSATARELLMATVDGQQAFELKAYDRAPDFAFAELTAGVIDNDARLQMQIETKGVRLDFADFTRLRGDREALAAFDPGFAVLHELAHGVWHLSDTDGARRQSGACDEQINRMRRELGLPERQGYTPRLRVVSANITRAELVFVRTRTPAGRASTERFDLCWEVEKVGSATRAASQFGARAGMTAAVR